MTRFAILVAILCAACAAPNKAVVSPPPPPAPMVVEEVKDPNFEAVVIEAVPNADEEGVSFTMVFVDGKFAGKTEVGPRSQEKRVKLKLAVGNQPVRLEQWFLPPVGEWTLLAEAHQPRERFIRIEDGTIARLTLRYDPAGRPSLAISREPSKP